MWNDTKKEKMVDKSLIWQLWNGGMKPEDAVKELNDGRKFVISCSASYYLDLPYALTSLEKAYNFEPAFDGLTEAGEKNLLGVEACLWTEFVPDMLTADKMTYPRLAAICESGWSPKEKKDFSRFTEKLDDYRELLGNLGVSCASMKMTSPKGVKKLAGMLWWERRKLCWGAHENILADYRVRKKIKDGKI